MNARKTAKEILDALYGRKGFDDWWDGIDEDIQDEIKDDIISILDNQ